MELGRSQGGGRVNPEEEEGYSQIWNQSQGWTPDQHGGNFRVYFPGTWVLLDQGQIWNLFENNVSIPDQYPCIVCKLKCDSDSSTLHLEMNLLVQRNTTWQLVLQLKPWWNFERTGLTGLSAQVSCWGRGPCGPPGSSSAVEADTEWTGRRSGHVRMLQG